MNARRWFSLQVVALFSGLGCWFLPSAQAQENAPERVVLQLKWYHQFQFSGYYIAKHLGYYEEAGLDVEIREGSPTTLMSKGASEDAYELQTFLRKARTRSRSLASFELRVRLANHVKSAFAFYNLAVSVAAFSGSE
jgi:NMT1/THI5 like